MYWRMQRNIHLQSIYSHSSRPENFIKNIFAETFSNCSWNTNSYLECWSYCRQPCSHYWLAAPVSVSRVYTLWTYIRGRRPSVCTPQSAFQVSEPIGHYRSCGARCLVHFLLRQPLLSGLLPVPPCDSFKTWNTWHWAACHSGEASDPCRRLPFRMPVGNQLCLLEREGDRGLLQFLRQMLSSTLRWTSTAFFHISPD